jgi:hypothetical protein
MNRVLQGLQIKIYDIFSAGDTTNLDISALIAEIFKAPAILW